MTSQWKSSILLLQVADDQHQWEDKMNLQLLDPVQTHHPIAPHLRVGQFGQLPQEPLMGWDAYSYPDEESIGDLAGEIALSRPELFCLPEVEPDEFEAVFDWFLS
jgi:hypothetical protein